MAQCRTLRSHRKPRHTLILLQFRSACLCGGGFPITKTVPIIDTNPHWYHLLPDFFSHDKYISNQKARLAYLYHIKRVQAERRLNVRLQCCQQWLLEMPIVLDCGSLISSHKCWSTPILNMFDVQSRQLLASPCIIAPSQVHPLLLTSGSWYVTEKHNYTVLTLHGRVTAKLHRSPQNEESLVAGTFETKSHN